jgi:Methyltransferase domain
MYSSGFYSAREARIARSAAALVPQLMSLFQPRSVLDVGCANGLWLRQFKSSGTPVVHGIDGPWVPRDQLRIDSAEFTTCDLGNANTLAALTLPLERFDLAISLEVLEHVSPVAGDALLDFMAARTDIIVASAATPHQGGTGHINEQWPAYWAARLQARGFEPFDFLRFAIWDDDEIAPWYRQNIIGYFRGSVPQAVVDFAHAGLDRMLSTPMPMCHPGVYAKKLSLFRRGVKNPLRVGWELLQEERAKRAGTAL